jgi:hypothetical protein
MLLLSQPTKAKRTCAVHAVKRAVCTCQNSLHLCSYCQQEIQSQLHPWQ